MMESEAKKRRFPRSLWLGLLLVLAAPFLFMLVFIRFPATRDVPWATLLMFAFGIGLLVHAMRRAYRDSATYRGKVMTPIALIVGVALGGFFSYGTLVGTRDLPPSSAAPRAGQRAPDFTLPDQDGRPVTLAELIAPAAGGAGHPGGVVLVFFRGHW
jgi:amino acid transporter